MNSKFSLLLHPKFVYEAVLDVSAGVCFKFYLILSSLMSPELCSVYVAVIKVPMHHGNIAHGVVSMLI